MRPLTPSKSGRAEGRRELLSKAVMGFNTVVKMLEENAAAYQQNDEEKQRNEQMRELAVIHQGGLPHPDQPAEDKLPVLRKLAISGYEEYVKRFPKGKYAPKRIADRTLYTILQDTANARPPSRSSEDLPESDEAKNSCRCRPPP
jgi:hypothetical protein